MAATTCSHTSMQLLTCMCLDGLLQGWWAQDVIADTSTTVNIPRAGDCMLQRSWREWRGPWQAVINIIVWPPGEVSLRCIR